MNLYIVPFSMFNSSDGSDARALTRLRGCAGSSDHSLLINEISTNISDIMDPLTFVKEFQR